VEWIRGIYGIIDVGHSRPPTAAVPLLEALLAGGVRVVQLRAKDLDDRALLELARALRQITSAASAKLIINDRADLAVLADADGVHLGQDDLRPEDVRGWLGEGRTIGLSCHDPEQVRAAVRASAANYLGVGPVFPTSTKANPDPVVGLDGLVACRAIDPSIPLVAIGGVTVEALPGVRSAGATAAAMIGALLGADDVTAAAAEAVRAWEDR